VDPRQAALVVEKANADDDSADKGFQKQFLKAEERGILELVGFADFEEAAQCGYVEYGETERDPVALLGCRITGRKEKWFIQDSIHFCGSTKSQSVGHKKSRVHNNEHGFILVR
jgi:hypothetical protein